MSWRVKAYECDQCGKTVPIDGNTREERRRARNSARKCGYVAAEFAWGESDDAQRREADRWDPADGDWDYLAEELGRPPNDDEQSIMIDAFRERIDKLLETLPDEDD